jgi:acyl-CoA thioesterase I
MKSALRFFVVFRYGAARAFCNCITAIALTLLVSVGASAARAEPLEVVALGDSLTQGYGLLPDEGFVPQMQAWLSAQGADVRLVNAGVSGDTTAGGVSRLDWSLGAQTDALIVNLGGNDMLRGLDPAVSRANLEKILQMAAAKNLPVLLVGLQGPTNFGPDYKAAFDAIYPELAAQYGAVLMPNYFAAIAPEGTQSGQLAAFMQGDGIHPNGDGVARIVADMGPKVLELLQKIAP